MPPIPLPSFRSVILILIFTLAGGLMMNACGSGTSPQTNLGELGADIHSQDEVDAFAKALPPAALQKTEATVQKFQTLPSSVMVEPLLIPMAQGTPQSIGSPGSCIAWSVGYGLGTFAANQAQQWGVDTANHQVSPAFLYEVILNEEGRSCPTGTKDGDYLNYLVRYGSPSLATIPYEPNCNYLNGIDLGTTPDPSFKIGSWQFVSPTDRNLVKAHLAEGLPLAFAGKVYEDFAAPLLDLDGVYHGSDGFVINPKTGQPDGHGMFLVGYDDTKGDPQLGQGAYLIMNSFGSDWGENGFIWMSYEAFENSQLTAFTARPLLPFPPADGITLTPNPDQPDIPQALLVEAFQWVDPDSTDDAVYLIFTYQFEAAVQLIEFVAESPSGAIIRQDINAWQNNSYTYYLRQDHQSFLAGTYAVTLNAMTQDGTDVSYTGTVDIAAPGSGSEGLLPEDFVAGILGGNGQPGQIE